MCNSMDVTPFHLACRLKPDWVAVQVAERLLKENADLVNMQMKKSKQKGVEAGSLEHLEMLLAKSTKSDKEKKKQNSSRMQALLPITSDQSYCKGFST